MRMAESALMNINARKLRRMIESQNLSQTTLAEKAQVSRGVINGVLQGRKNRVQARIAERLAFALRVPLQDLVEEDGLACYYRFVQKEHHCLTLRGLGVFPTIPLALDVVFVPIRAHRNRSTTNQPCSDEPEELSSRPAPPTVRIPESLSVAEIVRRYDRVLLFGDAGSGKTTVLRHLAWMVAGGHAGTFAGRTGALTPIFVPLADFAKSWKQEPDLDIVTWIAARARVEGCPDIEQPLRDELEAGNALLLLDGLDEVGDSGEAAWLPPFVERYRNNRFVVASRNNGGVTGVPTGVDFATFTIDPWDDKGIRTFTRNWSAGIHGHPADSRCKKCKEDAEGLWRAIVEHARVRAIATNPLMLTILAQLHHSNLALPRRRGELYAKVVEVCLDTWERTKQGSCPGDLLHGVTLEARECGWLLSALGLAMQRQDQIVVKHWWLTDFIQDFLHQNLGLPLEVGKDQAGAIIRYLTERSGLLTERTTDRFGFAHLTFQEYFAACGLLGEEGHPGQGTPIDRMRQFLYHPRWKEVVRLLAAQLRPSQATAFLRTLIDDPDPVGRFLQRGVILALQCLADGAIVNDPKLVEELFSGVVQLGRSPWLGITLRVLDALASLQGTRYEPHANRAISSLLSLAEKTLSSDDYLTLYLHVHDDVIPNLLRGGKGLPGEVRATEIEGHRLELICVSQEADNESEVGEWYSQLLAALQAPSVDEHVKALLVRGLGHAASANEEVRRMLEELLASEAGVRLRKACAWGLRNAAISFPSTAEILTRVLQNQQTSPGVRGACASVLDAVAVKDKQIRDELLELLRSSVCDTHLRAGAAFGLARLTATDTEVREALAELAGLDSTPPKVREVCVRALEDALGHDPAVENRLISCLAESNLPRLAGIAAQILAEGMADGRIEWCESLVTRVERVLMALSQPCCHDLHALRCLADARTIRAGFRLETVLAEALRKADGKVILAFVFGSVARAEQHRESDIDVFVVGDVRLKALAAPLTEAERTLGRRINPVIYSPNSVREKYRAKDPFLMEVLSGSKIPLVGDTNELGAIVQERASAAAQPDEK
jgi:predicted nucleotidyltransferase/plasmid stability protein/DNA-binding Xre family transcriptional regulator